MPLATNIQLSGVDLKVIAISSVQENEGNQPLQPTWPLPLRVRVTRPSWSTVISGTLSRQGFSVVGIRSKA